MRIRNGLILNRDLNNNILTQKNGYITGTLPFGSVDVRIPLDQVYLPPIPSGIVFEDPFSKGKFTFVQAIVTFSYSDDLTVTPAENRRNDTFIIKTNFWVRHVFAGSGPVYDVEYNFTNQINENTGMGSINTTISANFGVDDTIGAYIRLDYTGSTPPFTDAKYTIHYESYTQLDIAT